jgi:hypothetical protein
MQITGYIRQIQPYFRVLYATMAIGDVLIALGLTYLIPKVIPQS